MSFNFTNIYVKSARTLFFALLVFLAASPLISAPSGGGRCGLQIPKGGVKFERNANKTLGWTRIEILLKDVDGYDGYRDVKVDFFALYKFKGYREPVLALKGKARILGIEKDKSASVVFYMPPEVYDIYRIDENPAAWYAEVETEGNTYRKNMFEDDSGPNRALQNGGMRTAAEIIEQSKKAVDKASKSTVELLFPLNECPFYIQALEYERFGKRAKSRESVPTYLPAR